MCIFNGVFLAGENALWWINTRIPISSWHICFGGESPDQIHTGSLFGFFQGYKKLFASACASPSGAGVSEVLICAIKHLKKKRFNSSTAAPKMCFDSNSSLQRVWEFSPSLLLWTTHSDGWMMSALWIVICDSTSDDPAHYGDVLTHTHTHVHMLKKCSSFSQHVHRSARHCRWAQEGRCLRDSARVSIVTSKHLCVCLQKTAPVFNMSIGFTTIFQIHSYQVVGHWEKEVKQDRDTLEKIMGNIKIILIVLISRWC